MDSIKNNTMVVNMIPNIIPINSLVLIHSQRKNNDQV